MRKGAVKNISLEHNLNTNIRKDSELVVADDASIMILRTKIFIEAQGY